jgi:hypothetical protein
MVERVRCAFCGVESDHDEAIEAGWTPYFFWDEQTSCDEPVCPRCTAKHLRDFAGDPIVKPPVDESSN